jgi:hypothetical protein
MPQRCDLCGRCAKQGTTEHHLIPRTCHGNKWFKKRFTRQELQRTIAVCHDCHEAIHHLIPDEKELGRKYNTMETLVAHQEFARYLAWVKKRA